MDEEAANTGMGTLLEGKVAVITGAARGIGRAIALAYAREGARVVAADVDGAGLRDLEGALRQAGGDVLAAVADVTEAAGVQQIFDGAASAFGGVDILVNNAGGGLPTRFMEITEAEWDRMLAFNLKSVFLCCQAALRLMLPRGAGKIINMASVAGRSLSLTAGPHYAAAKAGVIGLTRNLAREMGPHGIRVNAICPGIIGTERLVRRLEATGRLATEGQGIPLRRLGTPEDVAGVAVFLASSHSDYMTGAMLDVNGGTLMI